MVCGMLGAVNVRLNHTASVEWFDVPPPIVHVTEVFTKEVCS